MIIFFGPQGSGKGTQAENLAKRNSWFWLSTGQMLRDSQDPAVHERQRSGELIDDTLTAKVLGEALSRIGWDKEVILDGYPRNLDQGRWLLDNVARHGQQLRCIIELDIPTEDSIRRLLARGRSDDTAEAIKRRLEIYHHETKPLIELYRQHGVPYRKVNGIGSVEEVEHRMQEAIEACRPR